MVFMARMRGCLGLMLLICLPAMIAVACATGPDSISAGTGVLTGRVTRGPLSPVEGIPGARKAAAVSGFRIVISASQGRQVESVVTNDQGQYLVNLPPGSYRISTAALARGGSTKDLPATVTITEGKDTHLDIRIDTGIR